ncbi:MAG TPA: EamA family transporter [Candidatus Wallbacteria bacterium]|nr:MAG: 4-amino-4-deoxy-L-arabinose-phosphoundecaprenol flippase subunit ArnE [bacterium ADurb.Bin243]HOD41430.1 EamA family transporter [Candidatus Wallbacteria bacterium]HPG56917.1 EamA family transporter [Candidatus Wallbacteria bacterium]
MIYLYLSITILGWGVGQTLLKIGFARSTPISSYLIGGILGLAVWLPYILVNKPVLTGIGLYLPLCLAISLAYLTFYYSLNAGELSIASAILGTYPMYTVLFAVFVMGEKLSWLQWCGLATITAGIGLLSYLSHPSPAAGTGSKEARDARIWLFLSVISAVLIGVADAMCKVVIDRTNVSAFSLYLNTVQICAGLLLKLLFEGREFSFETLKSRYSLAGILLLNIGGLTFTIALSMGQASIIVPLSSTYLALVTVLSWLFLKEKMGPMKAASISMVIAGIMML